MGITFATKIARMSHLFFMFFSDVMVQKTRPHIWFITIFTFISMFLFMNIFNVNSKTIFTGKWSITNVAFHNRRFFMKWPFVQSKICFAIKRFSTVLTFIIYKERKKVINRGITRSGNARNIKKTASIWLEPVLFFKGIFLTSHG